MFQGYNFEHNAEIERKGVVHMAHLFLFCLVQLGCFRCEAHMFTLTHCICLDYFPNPAKSRTESSTGGPLIETENALRTATQVISLRRCQVRTISTVAIGMVRPIAAAVNMRNPSSS